MEVKTFRNILLSLLLLLPSLGMAQDYGSGSPMVSISPAAAGGAVGYDFLADANCVGGWLIATTADSADYETAAETNRTTAGSVDLTWVTDTVTIGTGSPTVPAGSVADAVSISFDGGDDEFSVADPAADAFKSANFTFAVWVYHEAGANDAVAGTGGDNWYMRLNSNNGMRGEYNTAGLETSAGSLISVDDWDHVAIRYDTTVDDTEIFVNSADACNGACDASTDLTPNSTSFQIGERGGSNDYLGDMYEALYCNRPLTDIELVELMLCGADGLADGATRDSTYGGSALCATLTDSCCS